MRYADCKGVWLTANGQPCVTQPTSTPLPGLLKGPSYSYQVLQGRPREKPTLPVNLSSPPNSKPPIPHLNAKYLMLSK